MATLATPLKWNAIDLFLGGCTRGRRLVLPVGFLARPSSRGGRRLWKESSRCTGLGWIGAITSKVPFLSTLTALEIREATGPSRHGLLKGVCVRSIVPKVAWWGIGITEILGWGALVVMVCIQVASTSKMADVQVGELIILHVLILGCILLES